MSKKLEIQIGENKIVTEIYDMGSPEFPPEIVIYIKDRFGMILQDICCVRPHYVVDYKNDAVRISNDIVQCLVWSEPRIEDYTHKYIIGVNESEE